MDEKQKVLSLYVEIAIYIVIFLLQYIEKHIV